jgi:hypothetical protein
MVFSPKDASCTLPGKREWTRQAVSSPRAISSLSSRRRWPILKAVVTEAGGAMTDIVKLTLYVTDKADYRANLKTIGDVYRSCFGRYYPAMTLVEVKSLFDDEAMVEVEGLAVVDNYPKYTDHT